MQKKKKLSVALQDCLHNILACIIFIVTIYFQVAWVRVDTQTILSIHHNVITQNSRVTLTFNDHRSWYLHIREVEESDRGWYMCQVNTDPMRSRKGYLQVVGKFIQKHIIHLLSVYTLPVLSKSDIYL